MEKEKKGILQVPDRNLSIIEEVKNAIIPSFYLQGFCLLSHILMHHKTLTRQNLGI